jgi:DNA-binding SARP family transcriptional activator
MLGAVEVVVAGRPLDLGPPRQRCVLAALYLHHGRPLPISTLAARVWDDRTPKHADDALYSYLSRLRRILKPFAADPIQREAAGYRLTIDRDSIDYWRFEELVARASAATPYHLDRAAVLFREALALWRGEALTGVSGGWAERTRERLERRRLAIWGACFDVDLRAGRHAAIVDEIADLLVAHPDAEPLTAQLMVALSRTGRRADALAAYRRLRAAVAELHGLEPGVELRTLQAAVLRDDPVLEVRRTVPARPEGASR